CCNDAVDLTNGAYSLLLRHVTKAGLEHDVELTVLERHMDDGDGLVVLLQGLRRLRMDAAIVLDPPGIDAAFAQRADEFARRRPRDQEFVALALAPDDSDQLL